MPKKRCKKAECRALIDYSETYCDKHKGTSQQQYNRLKRENNNTLSNGVTEKEIASFYASMSWRNVRKIRLIQDNYICQPCLRNGIVHAADMVHHKIEIRDPNGWQHRLELENLESVNRSCHNKLKHRY